MLDSIIHKVNGNNNNKRIFYDKSNNEISKETLHLKRTVLKIMKISIMMIIMMIGLGLGLGLGSFRCLCLFNVSSSMNLSRRDVTIGEWRTYKGQHTSRV